MRKTILAAVIALILLAGGGWLAWRHFDRQPDFVTARGESRTVSLDDGSTVTMNVDSQIRVRFSGSRRRVIVDRGEVAFDIVADNARPFIAEVGTFELTGAAKAFDVRWIDRTLSVTLADGSLSAIDHAEGSDGQPIAIEPSQRLQILPGQAPFVGAVILADVRAWLKGQVVFSGVKVPDAVKELNRYSRRPIVIDGTGTELLKVDGTFSTTDMEPFFAAMRKKYRFKIDETPERITISPGGKITLPRGTLGT